MRYSNGEITGTYREVCAHFNASLPRAALEKWPEGPWSIVDSVQVDALADKVSELKVRREALISSPISNLEVARAGDRESIQGAIDNWALLGNPATIDWVTYNDQVQAVTRLELVNVLNEYVLRKARAFGIYTSLLAQLNGGASPDSVSWPE